MQQQEKTEKVNLVSKNHKWATWVYIDIARQLVNEGAVKEPTGKSNVFKMIYTKKELKDFIKERDKKTCRYCGKTGEEIDMLIPEEKGGLESPVNLVTSCKECKDKKQFEQKEKVMFIRNQNLSILKQKVEVTKKCLICGEEKPTEEFKFLSNHVTNSYCKTCVKKEQDLFYLLNGENQVIGTEKREEIDKMIYEGKAKYIGPKTVRYFEVAKKKKCQKCGTLKWKNSFFGDAEICKSCIQKETTEGIIDVLNSRNEKIGIISTDKAKELVKSGSAEFGEKRTIRMNTSLETIFFRLNKTTEKIFFNQKHIVVSRSGKWSTEATKREAEKLVKEGLAEFKELNIVRMIINIEDFKEKVIKRDRYTCQFCGKKASGVFSEEKIKMYSNSFCACIECEYERDPEKFLKWLNISEETGNWLVNFLLKRNKKGTMWLYEKNGVKKYKIDAEIGEKLAEEGMAEKLSKKEIKIKYTAKDFRLFILEREEKKCHYCGQKGDTVDHVIPKSRGGLTTPKNCVCACEDCNVKKGNSNKKRFVHSLNQKANRKN